MAITEREKSSIAHAIAEDDGVVWADGKAADDYDVLVYNQISSTTTS